MAETLVIDVSLNKMKVISGEVSNLNKKVSAFDKAIDRAYQKVERFNGQSILTKILFNTNIENTINGAKRSIGELSSYVKQQLSGFLTMLNDITNVVGKLGDIKVVIEAVFDTNINNLISSIKKELEKFLKVELEVISKKVFNVIMDTIASSDRTKSNYNLPNSEKDNITTNKVNEIPITNINYITQEVKRESQTGGQDVIQKVLSNMATFVETLNIAEKKVISATTVNLEGPIVYSGQIVAKEVLFIGKNIYGLNNPAGVSSGSLTRKQSGNVGEGTNENQKGDDGIFSKAGDTILDSAVTTFASEGIDAILGALDVPMGGYAGTFLVPIAKAAIMDGSSEAIFSGVIEGSINALAKAAIVASLSEIGIGAGAAITGSTAAAGVATVGGGIATSIGIADIVNDYIRIFQLEDPEEMIIQARATQSKAEIIAAGAAVGTFIYPGIGTLVGGGIGTLWADTYEKGGWARKDGEATIENYLKWGDRIDKVRQFFTGDKDKMTIREEYEAYKKGKGSGVGSLSQFVPEVKPSKDKISENSLENILKQKMEEIGIGSNKKPEVSSSKYGASVLKDQINNIFSEKKTDNSLPQLDPNWLKNQINGVTSDKKAESKLPYLDFDMLKEKVADDNLKSSSEQGAFGKIKEFMSGFNSEKIKKETEGPDWLDDLDFDNIFSIFDDESMFDSFNNSFEELFSEMDLEAFEALGERIAEAFEELDLEEAFIVLGDKFEEAFEELGEKFEEILRGEDSIFADFAELIGEAFEELDLEEAFIVLGDKFEEAFEELGEKFEEILRGEDSIFADFAELIGEAFEELDLEEAFVLLKEKFEEALRGDESIFADFGEIMQEVISEMDLESLIEMGDEIGQKINEGISEGMANNTEILEEGSSSIYEDAKAYIDTAFETAFDVTANVNIKANYKLENPSVSFSGSGNINIAAGRNANGNIVPGKMLTWVGEEGPEAIIPLVPGRRSRGIALWEKAGEMLGVAKHANGGIIGGIRQVGSSIMSSSPVQAVSDAINNFPWINSEESMDLTSNSYNYEDSFDSGESGSNDSSKVEVKINMNPKFEIAGENSSEEDIVGIIKAHMKEMADELGGEIAVNLEKVFSNMPIGEV